MLRCAQVLRDGVGGLWVVLCGGWVCCVGLAHVLVLCGGWVCCGVAVARVALCGDHVRCCVNLAGVLRVGDRGLVWLWQVCVREIVGVLSHEPW